MLLMLHCCILKGLLGLLRSYANDLSGFASVACSQMHFLFKRRLPKANFDHNYIFQIFNLPEEYIRRC